MTQKICNIIVVYFTIISFIFSATPLSFAQELPQQAQDAPPAKLETAPEAAEPERLEEAPKETAPVSGNVTIDFKGVDIRNVLRILSIKSGVNIVAGKDVEGTVTIHLVDVPWEKALDVVLKTYGFAYEREANIIRVATIENLGQEPLKTEVFKISYAKAEDIADSIKEIISARGTIRADKRSNALIVTDIPTNIYKIEQVITKLDEPTPQVYIEARVIETLLDDDEKLGVDWTVQVTATGAKIPTTLPLNRDLGKLRHIGVEHAVPLGDTAADFVNVDSPTFPLVDKTFTGTTAQWAFGTLNFSSFQAVLHMLDTRSDTKTISNPRMVTLNNQEATIHIGESLYVPQWQESTTTGSPVFSGLIKTDLDTGIKLKVTPHVNSREDIVVDLEPEVSSLGTKTALLTTSGGDDVFAWPVSVRTAKTQVMIKDSETIAIGGLMKEQTVKVRNKVPFLGDIPLLGHIFRYSEDRIDTKDLLIFITVKLIETKEDTEPLFKELTTRMDEFEHAPIAAGHQWEPDTPIGSGKKKKKPTRLIVE